MAGIGSKRGEKGFTLIEVLTVLGIISIIAVIATISVSQTLKRQRVEAAGNQLQSFIESASVFSRERSSGIFVWIHRDDAPEGGAQWWYCYLIQDANRNDILEYNITNPSEFPPGNGVDVPILTERMVLPADIVLAPTSGPSNQTPAIVDNVWPGPNNWPVSPNDVNDFLIMCDPRALPFDPNGPIQIQNPVVMSLTHSEMEDNVLKPGLRYDITISPLWHTKLNKIVY